MAKVDRDLFDTLRASGLRKKTANTLAEAFNKVDGSGPGRAGRKAVADLRSALAELEDRTRGARGSRRGTAAKRSAAAKKAAATRKRNATKRSNAAKKGARTRARSTSSRSRARAGSK